MITVLQRPDPIMLSGNPIDVEVLASRADGSPVVTPGGTRATVTGIAGQGLDRNVLLSLEWITPEGRARTVNFHTGRALSSAYEIPEYQGGDLGQYWETLASVIGQNREVSPYFFLSANRNLNGSYTLTATAKDNAPDWSVSWTSRDEELFSFVNDIAATHDASYRVRVHLYIDRGDGYEEIGRFGSPLNHRSRVAFNIGTVLNKAIEEVLTLPGIPSLDTANPYLGGNIYPYYVEIGEFSAETGYAPPVFLRGLKAFAGRVGGGLLATGNFLTRVFAGNSWLCARPDRRTISRKQPVFLSWLSPNESAISPSLKVEEFDEKGQVTSRILFAGVVTSADRQPIVYPVGVAALGVSEETVYYRVRVELNGNELSPWRLFAIDSRSYEEERYLGYLNSFYLPEIFRCTGDLESSISVSRQQYTRVRTLNDSAGIPGKATWRVDAEENYNYFTGYKPRLELVAVIREMIASPYVYHVTQNRRTALLMTGRSFDLGNPKDNLFAVLLPFELAQLELEAAFGSSPSPDLDPATDQIDVGGAVFDPGGDLPGGTDRPENWENENNSDWTNEGGTPWYNL